MRIQDSLYYQDYSYVIKVGQSIVNWRDAFKKTMHTACFYFTGQVDIESRITVTAWWSCQRCNFRQRRNTILTNCKYIILYNIW